MGSEDQRVGQIERGLGQGSRSGSEIEWTATEDQELGQTERGLGQKIKEWVREKARTESEDQELGRPERGLGQIIKNLVSQRED